MKSLAFSDDLNYTPLATQYFLYGVIGEKLLVSKKNITILLLVLTLLLTILVSLRLANSFKHEKPNQEVLTAATRIIPTETPTPTISSIPTVRIATPTLVPTLVPTDTPAPTQTPTPTPEQPDTTPPEITSMGGPDNGSITHSSSFCFPMTITDDKSIIPKIWTQYRFDSEDWTDWTNDTTEPHNAYKPCFQDVHEGEHKFAVHAKDAAGNVSGITARVFKVALISSH